MRKGLYLCLFVFVNSLIRGPDGSLTGFNETSALEELKKEKTFDSLISPENIGLTLRDLSSGPHNLGSRRQQGSCGKNSAEIPGIWITMCIWMFTRFYSLSPESGYWI